MNWKVWTALAIGLLLGFAATSAAYESLDAMKRSWAKRTAADCRTLSQALEAFRADNGHYAPLDGDIEHLRPYLTPQYLRQLPIRDMSNQPSLVVLNGSHAAVVSVGQNGAAAEAGSLIRGGLW
jgi:type II secretory pathway pseudopilin PulG